MAERCPDPGGGGGFSRDTSPASEDWKYVTNNGRVVILPDPRLHSILNQDDDNSSSASDYVHGQGLDDLEYDYEPGISLQHLEFASPRTSTVSAPDILSSVSRCPSCGVNYESDLQLAAELGKTLLERNKELEGTLKDQQAVIEDQSQEIEYLTKQTTTLREVNDSRVKIYEQLEVSISELECANKKLQEENLCDKVKIKSLSENIEKLENRCEELQRLLDEARSLLEKQQNQQRRRRERRKSSQQRKTGKTEKSDEEEEKESTSSGSTSDEELRCRTQESGYSSSSIESHLHRLQDSDSEMSSNPGDPQSTALQHHHKKSIEEEIILDTLRTDKIEIEERLQEMEKVVQSLQSENQRLQTLFASTSSQDSCESYKSVDDEVQDVHDVRRGKLCRKCLNVVDATPANLIGTAFQMMGETANQELARVFWQWQKDELRLRSRNAWIDLWFLAVCFLGLTLSISASMANGLLFLFR